MPTKVHKNTHRSSKVRLPKTSIVLPKLNVEEEYFAAINIEIISLESEFETGAFTLSVVYGNHLIGFIANVSVPPEGGRVEIKRMFQLQIKSADNYLMDALLSTPFFFSMLVGENRVNPKLFETFGLAAAVQPQVTGQGNLGLLPLLSGQVETVSYVVLEPPGYQETLFFRRTYSQHPKLLIRLTDVKKNLSSIKLHNIMWLSVESIYNVDATNFLDSADHTLVFPMPSTSISTEEFHFENLVAAAEKPVQIKFEDKKTIFAKKGKAKTRKDGSGYKGQSKTILKRSLTEKIDFKKLQKTIPRPHRFKPPVKLKKPSDFDLIQFDRGIYAEQPTIDLRKKWSSLASINGAPAMTNEKVKTDGGDLLSQIPIDIAQKFRQENEARIEWNMIRPIWLHEDLEKHFKNRILQYGVWPFEVLMMGKIYVDPKQLPEKTSRKLTETKKRFNIMKNKIDILINAFYDIVNESDENEELEVEANFSDKEQMRLVLAEMKKILLAYKRINIRRKKMMKHQLFAGRRRSRRKRASSNEEGSVMTITDFIEPSDEEETKAKTEKMPILSEKAFTLKKRKAYIAWMDLSPLLSPGCTHLRTAGLLQFFNEKEAIAKWNLTTTFSARPDEMSCTEKDFSRRWRVDSVSLFKMYGLIKKSKLIKNPVSCLILLGRLMDLRSKGPSFFKYEQSNRKRLKQEKAEQSEEPTSDHSDVMESEDHLLKKVRFSSLIANAGFLREIMDEEVNELDGSKKNQLKSYASKRNYHEYNNEDINTNESNSTDLSKVQSSNEETYNGISNKNFSDLRHLIPTTIPRLKRLPPLNQPNSHETGDGKLKTKSSHLENISTQMTSSTKLKMLSPKRLREQMDGPPTNFHIRSNDINKTKTDKKEVTSIAGSELLVDELKCKLVAVINKYHRLKERYKLLKTVNGKYVNRTTLTLKEDIDCDEGEAENQTPFAREELNIRRLEPRHKMWHFGKDLDSNAIKNQTQYTNVIRKLAILERKFLLLNKLHLAGMKSIWMEKAKDLEPEYFRNKKGDHVFVIVDIKLLKPLVPKPSIKKLELDIKAFLRGCNERNILEYHTKDPTNDFQNCIVSITRIINSEYQDYKKWYTVAAEPLSDELENHFYEYIEKSSAHKIITDSLNQGLTSYLASAVGDALPSVDKTDQKKLRYYVGWLYSRLVDEMQSIVNKIIIEGDRSLPENSIGDLPRISCEELYLFAVEAIEEMDYDRAKYYLAKRLEGENRTDPSKWIDYAVIALRIGDYQQASECIKESLVLDARCKEGLILYAVMLMMEGRFEEALLFFTALITFYPMFVEGWMAFHMFYVIVENKNGADITLVAGTKINRDHKLPPSYKPPQLSWDNNVLLADEPGSYMSTAVYFLSFNLYEFAEVCLAQELERTGLKNAAWVYYLSVCHYIQGRYEDSAKHLAKSITEVFSYNTDPNVWILLGHNCWQMGMKKCAVQIYLQAFTKSQTMKYAYMTYIRCGFFFLENGHAEFGKQMFLRAVKEEGTPMSWLGLGIALFMEGQIDDAELALREANMLDTTLAIAWGYLALISLYKLKQDHFLHCFRQAKRYGLKDKKLALQIEMISEDIISHSRTQQSINI